MLVICFTELGKVLSTKCLPGTHKIILLYPDANHLSEKNVLVKRFELEYHVGRYVYYNIRLSVLVYFVSRGVDTNPKAATSTRRTADQNGVHVEAVTSDLLSALQPRLEGSIDVLIFNPPYVVTPSEEES